MTKIIKEKISDVAGNARQLFYGAIMLLLVASFGYGYFVKETIMNVVERERVMTESRNLNSQIGDLESQYIAAKNNITINLAYEKGFKDVSSTDYISLRNVGKTLSYNTPNY